MTACKWYLEGESCGDDIIVSNRHWNSVRVQEGFDHLLVAREKQRKEAERRRKDDRKRSAWAQVLRDRVEPDGKHMLRNTHTNTQSESGRSLRMTWWTTLPLSRYLLPLSVTYDSIHLMLNSQLFTVVSVDVWWRSSLWICRNSLQFREKWLLHQNVAFKSPGRNVCAQAVVQLLGRHHILALVHRSSSTSTRSCSPAPTQILRVCVKPYCWRVWLDVLNEETKCNPAGWRLNENLLHQVKFLCQNRLSCSKLSKVLLLYWLSLSLQHE